MRRITAASLAALLCTLPALAQAPAPRPAVAIPPASFTDVQVARIDDLGKPMDLKADVWLPSVRGAATPLLLYIHGKGGSYKVRGNDRMAGMMIGLTQKGFAVATIDYRMSGRRRC